MQWGVNERLRLTRLDMLLNVMVGEDNKETLSPTSNLTSVHILMQMATQYVLELHQIDVKTTFLFQSL